MTPLSGLVLAGGRSTRMQEDKAGLVFGRRPQLAEAYAGGYLRISYALEIPNVPAQALVELEHRLMGAGIMFSTMQSETFADGAGI